MKTILISLQYKTYNINYTIHCNIITTKLFLNATGTKTSLKIGLRLHDTTACKSQSLIATK